MNELPYGIHYRAWRFVHPDMESSSETGLQFREGRLALVEDYEAVRQSIQLLLSTRPGERVMRPEYGCHLYRLIFSPNDETTAGLAIHYVRQAVGRWEPRAEIERLDADVDAGDPTRLNLVMEYHVRGLERLQRLEFSLPLMEEKS